MRNQIVKDLARGRKTIFTVELSTLWVNLCSKDKDKAFPKPEAQHMGSTRFPFVLCTRILHTSRSTWVTHVFPCFVY